MSKDIIRIIVVIVLIAIVTTIVWFVINKPDDNKKLYDNYISLTKDDGYKNYDYFTKEIIDENNGNVYTILDESFRLKQHFRLIEAIKNQIEKDLILLDYVSTVDSKVQDNLLNRLKNYNNVAFGDDGVSYQARYLYEYITRNKVDNTVKNGLIIKLINVMHEMEIVGRELIGDLNNFVVTYVYNGTKIEDIAYVLSDMHSVIASACSMYENVGNDDSLNENIGKYENYLTRVESLIEQGEKNGYNTLASEDMQEFILNYNLLSRELIIELLNADNKTEYITNQTDQAITYSLTKVLNFLEGGVWVKFLV